MRAVPKSLVKVIEQHRRFLKSMVLQVSSRGRWKQVRGASKQFDKAPREAHAVARTLLDAAFAHREKYQNAGRYRVRLGCRHGVQIYSKFATVLDATEETPAAPPDATRRDVVDAIDRLTLVLALDMRHDDAFLRRVGAQEYRAAMLEAGDTLDKIVTGLASRVRGRLARDAG